MRSKIIIEPVSGFNAHGARLVYARSGSFPAKALFYMHVWDDRASTLLVRFWSRGKDVENRSIIVTGMSIAKRKDGIGFSDAWIPKLLHSEYESWVLENL